MSSLPAAGGRRGGRRRRVLLRRRRVLLLRLLGLEVRDLLILLLLGGGILRTLLAGVVRNTAHDRCASKWPSSHTHVGSPLEVQRRRGSDRDSPSDYSIRRPSDEVHTLCNCERSALWLRVTPARS